MKKLISFAVVFLALMLGASLLLFFDYILPWDDASTLPVRIDIIAGLLAYFYACAEVTRRLTSRFKPRGPGWQKPVEAQKIFVRVLAGLSILITYGLTERAGAHPVMNMVLAFLFGFGILAIPCLSLYRRGMILRRIAKRAGSLETRSLDGVHLTYLDCLNRTLEDALDLCTIPRARYAFRQPARRSSAILFVPDPVAGHFMPIAVRSPSDRYEAIARGIRPPFFHLEEFVKIYNRHCDEATGPAAKEIKRAERIRQFRKDTKGIVSTCALVAARGKYFLFDNVFDNCLTFDFDFLTSIHDPQERQRLQFRPLAAVPARFGGSLLGVLLLLGDKTVQFSRDPSLYEQLQDLVGHTLEIGRIHRLLPLGGNDALDSPTLFAYRSRFCKLVNTMSSRFDKSISEALLRETCDTLRKEQPDDEEGSTRGPVRLARMSKE